MIIRNTLFSLWNFRLTKTNRSPLISVCMPVYNMEAFLFRSSWPLTPCFWSRAIPQGTFEGPPDEPI